MRHTSLRCGIAVLSAVLLAAPLPLLAQRRTPGVYAITNARIVPVAGATIPRGTIVVRDGLIAAVGANVTVPADAQQIDGAGLTVYPGLIDAATSLGMPAPQTRGGGTGGGGGGGFGGAGGAQLASLDVPGSTQRPGLQPEVVAADLLETGGDQLEAARNAGITAALTAPRTGIFQGQSAFILLAGDEPHEMIVRTPVALNMGFTPLPGGYPGSLLGVFSAVRQILLDAQHYGQVKAMYERDPRGIPRPATDKSLEALQPVLRREVPVIMFADQERQIRRALDLAEEFELRVIIAGGGEAWMLADRLKAMNVPVLATLNFPRRTAAPSPDAEPEPVRVLRERVEAPKNPGRLHQAGVRFAFTSGGATNLADFRANASRAVENGLPAEQALRAMTIVPAELFGVANRVGTIETGKIANLTVVRGDLFDRDARVTHVFVDGRPTEIAPPAAASQQAAGERGAARAGGGAPANIADGTWSLTVAIGEQQVPVTLQLQQNGEQLRGTLQGGFGSVEIADGRVNADSTFRFSASGTIEGLTREAVFEGTITGDQMRGTVTVTGMAPGTFTGSKPRS